MVSSLIMMSLLTQVPGNVPPPAPPEDRPTLASLMASGIDLPANLKPYPRTRWTQRLTITNGLDTLLPVHENQDDYFQNAPMKQNPNRMFPWRNSGGMDVVDEREWTSRTALSIPEGKAVEYWQERIHAGASHPLPKVAWHYPRGTVAADLLSYRGEPFELRTLTKGEDGRWRGRVAWEDPTKRPLSYKGAGRPCMDCHRHAGGFLEYGMLIRGNDHLFSPPVLREGTLTPDTQGPIPTKPWSGTN